MCREGLALGGSRDIRPQETEKVAGVSGKAGGGQGYRWGEGELLPPCCCFLGSW